MSATLSPPVIPTSTITDPPTFRLHFPEFSSTRDYPDVNVQMYIDLGSIMLRPVRWGSYIQRGVELYTAHSLSMAYGSAGSGAAGGAPGGSSGLVSSKSVSKVSVSYDLSSTSMEGGGPWNYTRYGQEFLWWARMIGIGGVEILSLTDPRVTSGGYIPGYTGYLR